MSPRRSYVSVQGCIVAAVKRGKTDEPYLGSVELQRKRVNHIQLYVKMYQVDNMERPTPES